jgi:hypothetical protein
MVENHQDYGQAAKEIDFPYAGGDGFYHFVKRIISSPEERSQESGKLNFPGIPQFV